LNFGFKSECFLPKLQVDATPRKIKKRITVADVERDPTWIKVSLKNKNISEIEIPKERNDSDSETD
jgi:hypothetical protein